jgi:hypothetical protein
MIGTGQHGCKGGGILVVVAVLDLAFFRSLY